MTDITNPEVTQTIPKVVEQIRKPEARSVYSDVLATTMKDYLEELFDQPAQPAMATELKQRHGLVLFEGSILRGTATEKTHDFDIFIMADDQPIDPDLSQELAIFTRDVEDYHPEKVEFSDYLIRRLLSDPKMKPFYDARVSELQRRKDYTDRSYSRPPGPAKLELHHVIHTDTQFDKLQNFLDAIQSGNDAALSQNETSSRMIVSILTATPDLVYEIAPGSLLYHQRRIVEALAKLQIASPDKFGQFYALLEKDFANLHRSTAWRYPERDFQLLGEYYLRSGRFTPQHVEAKQLVSMTSQHLTQAVISEEFKYYENKFDEYRKDPEKLLELMTKKHGVETGLAREDLEKIVRGENLVNQDETRLSPEAFKELANFEKRIKLLAAIRRQIKMPTLEEFKQAYLRAK